ncbi:hypothetical protein M231_02481 [Tremella mesenterica]|uniref:Nicotinamide N-methyltransferase n=1 Tax=Tremella mesenterica TaxID=5217 RepID=A0A4V1M4F7_TREME|nr:hypothetical protein M231_02481 [Tremella mesenterica]
MTSEQEVQDPVDIFDTSLSTLFNIPPIAFSPSSSDKLIPYSPSPIPQRPSSHSPYTTSFHPIPSQSPITISTPPQAPPSEAKSITFPIQLQLPQPPAELFTTLQAQNLWLSSIYLADLFCSPTSPLSSFAFSDLPPYDSPSHSSHSPSIRPELRIAELGAGSGLPGIIACLQGHRVVSTDWGVSEVLDVIRGNFQRACGDSHGRWEVVGHQWGDNPNPVLKALPSPSPSETVMNYTSNDFATSLPPSSNKHQLENSLMNKNHATDVSNPQEVYNKEEGRNDQDVPRMGPDKIGRLEEKFDVLLLADLIWISDSHPFLLDSIFSLLRPGGEAYITAGLHTGRGPVERFCQSAEKRGGVIVKFPDVRWSPQGWKGYSREEGGLEEERGVVVSMILRVP